MTQPIPAAESAAAESADKVKAHLQAICEEAGLEVMMGVFDVLRDREQVTDEQFLALTADNVDGFYCGYLGRAIDDIERGLLGDYD